MDFAMSVAGELYAVELTLIKENFKEINNLELKKFKLNTNKSYGLNTNQELQQKIDQADVEIKEVRARTTRQICMQKVEGFDNSSRVLDAFLRLSLDLVEKKIVYCREIQFKISEKEQKTLKREIGLLESKAFKIVLLLNDTNHPDRKLYSLEMVRNFAWIVAKLLVNQPIEDDELKMALYMFEIKFHKVDFCNYQIVKLILSKGRELRDSIAYKNIANEISILDIEGSSHRESNELRSSLRTIQRLTNGNCKHLVDLRLVMVFVQKMACIQLVNNEMYELSLITDLSVNKNELVTTHQHFKLEMYDEIYELGDMLFGNDNEGRTLFNDDMFEEVTKLYDDEIELLDKVLYNEEIHDKKCPVCLKEHTIDELLVSLRCPCKRKKLCQDCAFKAMKEKSQCPCCRAYI